MKETFLLVSLLYILPTALSYLFVRKILVEENRYPDIKDVLIPFTPALNILIAVFYLIFTVIDFIEGKKGNKLMKKFYRL